MQLHIANTSTHFQTAANILNAATQWMIENDVPNWQLNQFDPIQMQQQTNATIYLALHDGVSVGTVQLQDVDALFWPEIASDDTIFVHKLAVLPEMTGQRIGYQLLDAVCAIGRARGLKWLRLDCRVDRPKLRQYYERYGFQFVDEVKVRPHNMSARYQISINA